MCPHLHDSPDSLSVERLHEYPRNLLYRLGSDQTKDHAVTDRLARFMFTKLKNL